MFSSLIVLPRDNIFIPSRGSRKKASKVMVVLTDGDIFQDPLNLTTVINSPKMQGVERFAIGVREPGARRDSFPLHSLGGEEPLIGASENSVPKCFLFTNTHFLLVPMHCDPLDLLTEGLFPSDGHSSLAECDGESPQEGSWRKWWGSVSWRTNRRSWPRVWGSTLQAEGAACTEMRRSLAP